MIKLVSAFAFLVAFSAGAQAQSLQQQMARCVGVSGTLQRLACYDAAARDAGLSAPRTAFATPPAYVPPAQSAYAAPAPQTYAPAPLPGGMGSERLPSTVTRQKTQALVAMVSAIQFDGYGRFTVTLDNGQVWRQLSGDEAILRNPKITQVKITRGAIGSYDLTVPGLHTNFRVTRLN